MSDAASAHLRAADPVLAGERGGLGPVEHLHADAGEVGVDEFAAVLVDLA